MKNRNGIVNILGLAFVLITLGCSSSSTDPGTGDGSNGNPPGGSTGLSMQINGTAWTAIVASVDTIVSEGVVISLGMAGSSAPQDAFAIGIADLGGVKETSYSFPTGTPGIVLSATFVSSSDTTLTSSLYPNQASGTLTITSINLGEGHISGTFTFDLYNIDSGETVEIRSGVLDKIPFLP